MINLRGLALCCVEVENISYIKNMNMAKKISLQHRESGLTQNGFYGFSWTFLFFSGFVSYRRGEPAQGFAHLALTVITSGIWNIIFSFFYNRRFMKRKLANGWNLVGTDTEIRAAENALGIKQTTQFREWTRYLVSFRKPK